MSNSQLKCRPTHVQLNTRVRQTRWSRLSTDAIVRVDGFGIDSLGATRNHKGMRLLRI